MSEKIKERAYLLWEEAGRPEGVSEPFWLEAERELTVKEWRITSGDYTVDGLGALDEVIDVALRAAHQAQMLPRLGEAIIAEDQYGAKAIPTTSRLQALGLTS